MAKDYARRQPAATKHSAQIPGWMWMLVGVLIGVIASGIVFMRDASKVAQVVESLPRVKIEPGESAQPEPKPAVPAPAVPPAAPAVPVAAAAKPADPKAETKPEAKPEQKPGDAKMDYAFYQLLQEQEVAVVEEPPKDKEKPKELPAGKYIVQVGSYQTLREAEEQKARLALTVGEMATVQTVNVNGTAWHRVRLGPYTDSKAVDRMREKLKSNGLKYVVVQEKS